MHAKNKRGGAHLKNETARKKIRKKRTRPAVAPVVGAGFAGDGLLFAAPWGGCGGGCCGGGGCDPPVFLLFFLSSLSLLLRNMMPVFLQIAIQFFVYSNSCL